MSNNVIVWAVVIGLTVFILLVRKLLNVAVDKGFDAIHNAKVRREEENNPPKTESLADRYKTDGENKE